MNPVVYICLAIAAIAAMAALFPDIHTREIEEKIRNSRDSYYDYHNWK